METIVPPTAGNAWRNSAPPRAGTAETTENSSAAGARRSGASRVASGVTSA